jgi:hypothetical protein
MSTCTSPPLASLTSSVGILPAIHSQIKQKTFMNKMYTSITKEAVFPNHKTTHKKIWLNSFRLWNKLSISWELRLSFKCTRMMTGKRGKKVMQRGQNIACKTVKGKLIRPFPMNLNGNGPRLSYTQLNSGQKIKFLIVDVSSRPAGFNHRIPCSQDYHNCSFKTAPFPMRFQSWQNSRS